MAEQVALALEEAILAGEWQGGDALPTEPRLAELFDVSRAVVRDATRMLAARGLVEAQHGRGVFVTESQKPAFGGALLLALRRARASVWDVEQFEQMTFPAVCALATAAATDGELQQIISLAQAYLDAFARHTLAPPQTRDAAGGPAIEEIRVAFNAMQLAIHKATHNALWQLLAEPLLHLRSIRQWADEDTGPEEWIVNEAHFVATLLAALCSRDPHLAQQTVSWLMRLPPEAQKAMAATPVGEAPRIPIAFRLAR